MRVFFIGSVEFSRAALNCLLEINCAEIVGIATKSQSQFNADHSDLKDIADAHGIPSKYVRDINEAKIIDWIRSLNADVIYCMGWSALIGKELLNLCPLGVIGFHPALLPQNRGRHPLIWALALGLRETGTSFFKMDEGADSGDILSQESYPIVEDDTAADLYTKMTASALKQIRQFTPLLNTGTHQLRKQNNSIANYWRKRGKADGKIDFRMTSESIYNLVRALTKPYVGAHFESNNAEYKVWRSILGPEQKSNLEPGQILAIGQKKEILVKTGNGSIWLLDHELETLPSISDYLK